AGALIGGDSHRADERLGRAVFRRIGQVDGAVDQDLDIKTVGTGGAEQVNHGVAFDIIYLKGIVRPVRDELADTAQICIHDYDGSNTRGRGEAGATEAER